MLSSKTNNRSLRIKELNLEKELLNDAEAIEQVEKQIEKEQRKLERLEKDLFSDLAKRPKLGMFSRPHNREVSHVHDYVLRKLSKHKFIYALLVSFGVVLVWRGLWDISEKVPFLASEFVALALGLLILWFTQKYSDMH